MADIQVRFIDEVHAQIITEDRGTMAHLAEHFVFAAKNAKWDPRYKLRQWDGNIRLLNQTTGLIYFGLLKRLEGIAKKFGYTLEYLFENEANEFSIAEANEFIGTLNIPAAYTPRDYQVAGFVHAVRYNRATFLLATGGGKSLLMYLCWRYYVSKSFRVLIVVPTAGLVEQMYGDFIKYGFKGAEKFTHRISYDNGSMRHSRAPVQISTWQSIQNMPKKWFRKFSVFFGDEGHQYGSSGALISMLEKMTEIPIKYALTGTLDFDTIDPLVIEGLFGPIEEVGGLKKLTDEGYLAQITVKCIVLGHPDAARRELKNSTYKDEMDYLVGCSYRNNFIRNLTLSLPGKRLLLFNYNIHGEELYKIISERNNDPSINIYLLYGKVSPKKRELVREAVNDSATDDIIIASFGVFQMGLDVPDLSNGIIASSSLSKYRVLQSIGRFTRKTPATPHAVVHDVADDLRYLRGKRNHTLRHFVDTRVPYYSTEGIPYKIYNVRLNG